MTPRPRPVSRRGWALIAFSGVLLAGAFWATLTGYSTEGGVATVGGLGATADQGVIVTIDPVSVDPLAGTALLHLAFDAQGTNVIDENGRLVQGTRITVTSGSGIQEVRFPAGAAAKAMDATVAIDGEFAQYPFDEHSGGFFVSVDTYENQSGAIVSTGDVPVGMQATSAGVNGWDTTLAMPTGFSTGGDSGVMVTFQRAFSTQVFAFVLIALAAILGVLTLSVALLVFTSRRRVEVTFLPWTAGVLFALPLLRNYLPNSPPIGAAIDIYIYLWTIVASVIALVLVVIAWARKNRAELEADLTRKEREASGAP